MMKVCHMTTIHPRYDIRIYHKECLALKKAGLDVSLIVNDAYDDETMDGVDIHSLKLPFKGKLKRFLSNKVNRALLKKAIELDADIYHFHDPELLRVGKKLKKRGYRVVYDVHEDVPRQILAKEWIPKLFRGIISRFFERYEDKTSRRFDAIVVPTPHLQERFLRVNRIVYEVCNFPSLDDIAFSEEGYSNQHDAIYVGDLTTTRGIREIAEATFQADIGLTLCGEFHSKGLEEAVMRYPNVTHLGFLDRSGIS